MDPPRTSQPVLARAAAASSLPVRGDQRAPLPPIYERLARPETQEEYFDGELRLKMPANPRHAQHHIRLAYVLEAHVAEGYQGAVEMLTRTGHQTDFAPDASVYPVDPDPENGERQIEELAFEVCSDQQLQVPTFKARELVGRGVRRVFCIVVGGAGQGRRRRRQHSHLLEWSPRLDGWAPVPEEAMIEDRCLDPPLPVKGLLDAAAKDEAVARALLARGNPVLEEELAKRRAEGLAEGEAKGRAETLVLIIEARGLVLSEPARRRILDCRDPGRLEGWTQQALTISTVDDLWSSQ